MQSLDLRQLSGHSNLSGWKLNLLAFGCLIVVVMGYYYWQIRQTRATFALRVQAHSEMLAGVVRQNAENALLSQQGIEEILTTFLGNTCRFVEYLDQIEPFSAQELAEFAVEAGLQGIFIQRADGSRTSGPDGWLTVDSRTLLAADSSPLHWFPDRHRYVMTLNGGDNTMIAVGFAAAKIEALQRKLSLDELLDKLSRLPGIRYVKFADPAATPATAARGIESKLEINGRELLIALDNSNFLQRNRQLWREFLSFSGLLTLLGGVFSWLLYRSQVKSLQQMQAFEQQLSQQREDAGLGQATAAITHEIRNPLNAISMGLQRLRLESGSLSPAQSELIATMHEAVHRTNLIVTDLQRYAQPLVPLRDAVNLTTLVAGVVTLYQAQSKAQQVTVEFQTVDPCYAEGDAALLGQVVENLFKNSLEAQPSGGWIKLRTGTDRGQVWLEISNGGFKLAAEETRKVLQPYFTTKSRGTGLGLNIVQRIIQAHQGTLDITTPAVESLAIRIHLPKGQDPGRVEEQT